MGKRTNWKGWIKPEDVDPGLLAKFVLYRERYHQYRKSLPIGSAFGTGNSPDAHRKAAEDVPLTPEETEMMRRVEPEFYRPIDERFR